MKSPEALFCMQRQPTGNSATPSGTRYEPPSGQGSTATSGHPQSHLAIPPTANYHLPSPATGNCNTAVSGHSGLRTPDGSWDPSSIAAQLHPAIRSHYAAMLQRKQAQPPAHTQNQTPMMSSPPAYAQSQAMPHALQYPQTQQPYTSHCSPGLPEAQQPPMHGPAGQAYPQSTQPSNMAALPNQPLSQQPQMYAQVSYTQRGSPSFYPSVPNNASPDPTPTAHIGGVYQASAYPASAQSIPAAPKQTFVPPPRPWEQIQKSSQPNRISQPAEAQPVGMPSLKSHSPQQPLQNMGHQIRTPETATACTHESPVIDHPSMESPMSPPPVPQHSKGFPEVPEESQALVEDIIMNARRASGSDFAR
jgi:hypothetical protein